VFVCFYPRAVMPTLQSLSYRYQILPNSVNCFKSFITRQKNLTLSARSFDIRGTISNVRYIQRMLSCRPALSVDCLVVFIMAVHRCDRAVIELFVRYGR